jgi:hypothetical protein
MKVGILGNDREAVFQGEGPYRLVISSFEPDEADVGGAGIEGSKTL